MRDEDPTVFVIPPNDSLLCPLHFGVLEAPVDTPCGCTFCRRCIIDELTTKAECPVHGTPLSPEHLRDNRQAQGAIDSLLIHCKGGLQRTAAGEWVSNPLGCRLWLSLGKRKEHEDSCTYIKRAGERAPASPAPVRTCYYRQHGCLFVGYSEQDIMVHGASCGYGRLLQQLELLQNRLVDKDTEIERLNGLLAEKEQKSISLPNVNEVLDSVTRGLEKLDQDSTRLFEDAKDTLKKTKTNIVNSAAYQTSLQVLHSIKEVVESAKTEFIAKLDELLSKHKVRLITNGPIKNSNNNDKNNNNNTTTSSENTTEPSTTTPIDSTPINEESKESEESSSLLVDTAPTMQDNFTSNTNVMADNSEHETEGDEDLKEFLKISKREYLRDQEAKLAEEESIRLAVRLSLLDQQDKSN